MRVGIYDPYLDDIGGGEKYMLTIAECLSREHDVEVFWDHKADLAKVLERFTLDLSRVKLTKNIFSPDFGFLNRILKTLAYDVIIFLSDGSIPFVLSKKLLLHFQSPLQLHKPSLKTKLKISRVDSIFCNAYFTKSYIDKTFGVTSVVLYPPVSLHAKSVKKENIILHVGRFRVRNVEIGDYKKQDAMVEAFKEMVKDGLSNWEFVLAVGVQEKDRNTFEKFKKTAKGFPIDFLVNRNNRELWEVYNKAKVYWHASGYDEDLAKHPEFAEHFGISTVEAMGAGVVPIVINAGGQKEIVEDGVNGFVWNTLSQLKEKTLQVIQNEKLFLKLSQNAKQRAKVFSKDRFCRDVVKLIKD